MTPPAAAAAEALLSKPLRVVAVDDQALFLEALSVVLSLAPDLEVVAEAHDGAAGVDLALVHRPDVVLMDVDMPRMDGFEATRRITAALPETAVVMVTGSSLAADVERARAAGAAGYVTKDRLATDLTASIRRVASIRALRGAQVFAPVDIPSHIRPPLPPCRSGPSGRACFLPGGRPGRRASPPR